MEQLVIGDLHFGRYANKVTWLESQVDYFHNVIFKVIEENKDTLNQIVFLGDIFENRYAINVQVGCEVKKLFKELSQLIKDTNILVYICAGNHDYYSPFEELKDYNAYEMLFGEEFTTYHKNFIIVKDEAYIDNDMLFCHWYDADTPDKLLNLLEDYKCRNIKTIFCHTDIEQFTQDLNNYLMSHNISVFSGHIHQPFTNTLSDTSILYNVGAALPLDFNDANSYRYIYLVKDNKIIKKYKNTTTLQFRIYYNEQIFTLDESSFENATTRIFVSSKNIDTARYVEQLNYIKTTFACDYKIKIMKIEDDFDLSNIGELSIVTNINSFIEKNIPTHLMKKYNYIKSKIKEI